MQDTDRKRAQTSGNDVQRQQHAPQPAPGKVTPTSRVASSAAAQVQRKAPASGVPRVQASTGSDADTWMDAAHRGGAAFAQPSQAVQGLAVQKQDARADELLMAATDPLGALSVRGNADKAFAAAGATGLPGPRDGLRDAFRHTYWNALCARDIGAMRTSKFTTLHEVGMNPANDPHDPSYDPIAIQMDLFNNRVGRQIGTGNPFASDQDLAQLVQQALANGELRVLKMDPSGNYLDASGNVTTDRRNFVLVPSNHPSLRGGTAVYKNKYAP